MIMWSTTANYTLRTHCGPFERPTMFSLPAICGGYPVEGLAMLSALAFAVWVEGILAAWGARPLRRTAGSLLGVDC